MFEIHDTHDGNINQTRKINDMMKLIPRLFNQDISNNQILCSSFGLNPPDAILRMQILPLVLREENIMIMNEISFL